MSYTEESPEATVKGPSHIVAACTGLPLIIMHIMMMAVTTLTVVIARIAIVCITHTYIDNTSSE
jgi:hypothetical protein